MQHRELIRRSLAAGTLLLGCGLVTLVPAVAQGNWPTERPSPTWCRSHQAATPTRSRA